jgi:ketol-acid reductoisomerase
VEAFELVDIRESLKDVIPDEAMPGIFREEIKPYLKHGAVVCFASGFDIAYHLLEPPKDVDVVMVAPRMGGKEVRELCESDKGFPSFIAVHQDFSGLAKKTVLALAKMIGSTKGNSPVFEVSFEQEAFTDLLTEQGLCPLIMAAFMAKYEVDIENGIPAEAALLELHLSGEWAEDFQRMAEMGIIKQLPLHSMASQYGQLSRTNEILTHKRSQREFDYSMLKSFVQEQAEKIKDGEFARELLIEQSLQYPVLKKLYEKFENSPMITKEQETLKMLRGKAFRDEK